jgi:hypothetical protein
MMWFLCGFIALGMSIKPSMGFWETFLTICAGPISLGIALKEALE